MALFRIYEPYECGPDGYPTVWHKGIVMLPEHKDPSMQGPRLWIEEFDGGREPALKDTVGIKDVVRALAGHRCERCKHPFRVGATGEFAEKPESTQTFTPADFGAEVREQWPELVAARSKTIRTHWSPCDPQCCHTGPMRVMCRQLDGGEAWEPFDPTSEACGAAVEAVSPTPVQAAWRILTVHHLNGRKHDLRWWNLAALCQRCHLEVQGKVQMERVYPFEHTEWFKIHAAGWYSYAYEGREISREEAVDRLDELLALERML